MGEYSLDDHDGVTYMQDARDCTNLKIPKADADLSANTPPRIEVTLAVDQQT